MAMEEPTPAQPEPNPKNAFPLFSFGSWRAKCHSTVGSHEWKTCKKTVGASFITPDQIYSYLKHLDPDAKTLLQLPHAGDFCEIQ